MNVSLSKGNMIPLHKMSLALNCTIWCPTYWNTNKFKHEESVGYSVSDFKILQDLPKPQHRL